MSKLQFEDRLQGRKDAVGADFDKALNVFIADRKRMACTERTIEWYEEVLGQYFRAFLTEKEMPLEPQKWISTDIEDYMDYLLHERNCKPVTCKNRFSALRAWCNFLYRKGYIETNPIADLAPMKVKKEITKTLPDNIQLDALKQFGCDKIYEEKMSGKRDDRPELNRLLDQLWRGDTLVVYKLDRLGRSTFKLLELTAELERKGVEFVSIRDNIDTTSAVGKAMFRMLAVLAEMEGDIIAERTRAGIQAAKARGSYGGRPRTDKSKLDAAMTLYQAGKMSIPEIVDVTGVSKATLYRYINKSKLGSSQR